MCISINNKRRTNKSYRINKLKLYAHGFFMSQLKGLVLNCCSCLTNVI